MRNLPCIILLSILTLISCKKDNNSYNEVDFRKEMRDFVIEVKQYAISFNNDFIVIPQNGQELITQNGESNGGLSKNYLNAINGVGREDLFYGYEEDNISTPEVETNYMISFLDVCKQNNMQVLVTDYCYSHEKMDDSYVKNGEQGYISFAAPERELNIIPSYPAEPYNVNTDNINDLAQARNFLYLINPEQFNSKEDFLNALKSTSYDLLIIDCFYDEIVLTKQDINTLKIKNNGGRRMVVAYISIGEAEDYRYYWKDVWFDDPPEWIAGANHAWPGNYKVLYWQQDWKDIIFGNDVSYIKKILEAGFDGAYLDIIDAFEYFENNDIPID